MNYSRAGSPACVAPVAGKAAGYREIRGAGGGRWIRTTEGVSQQIYSLPPLAAWVSLRITADPMQPDWPNQTTLKQPEILA